MESQMILAAKKIFGITEAAAMENYNVLQNVPIQLVEYAQLLPGEGKREYDSRREQTGVYTGEIKTLVKHLTRLSKSKAEGLLPWEIIFTYFKQVNPDFLSESEHEETPMEPESQKVDESVEVQPAAEMGEDVHAEVVAESAATVVEEQSPAVHKELTYKDEATAAKDEQAEDGAVISATTWETDKVRVNKNEEQVTAKCDTNLEVNEMADVKDLEALASELTNGKDLGVDAPATTGDTKASKGTKPARYEAAVTDSVTNEFQGSMEERTNFVKENPITLLVATAPSVLERLVVSQNITGKLAVATGDAAKAAEAITKKLDNKLNGLVKKMTGKADMDYAKWAQLPEAEQYAQVVMVDSEGNATNANKEMAKKAVELIVAAKANPAMDIALAAPATKNVAYKGLEIGNVKYPKAEITALLIDKSVNGSLYGEGMIDAEGKKTEAAQDNTTLVEVKLSTKKVVKHNDTGVVDNTNATTIYKPTTVLKGRTTFVEKGLVSYLFPTIDKEEEKTTSLTVLIDGKPATFKYYKVDEKGNRVSVGKDDKVHDAVQTASLKGSGAVYGVVRELPAEYIGALTETQAANRWDVKLPAQKSDSEFVADFDKSKIFEVLTIKNADFSGIQSSTYDKTMAIIKSKKQAEAADAEQSFGY